MPRPNRGARLVLYGPDERLGAKRRAGFKRYLWYVVWYEGRRQREHSTGAENRADAEKYFHEEWWLRFSRRPTGPRDPWQLSIAEALAIYGEEHAPETADPKRIGDCINALVDYWGDRMCSDIKGTTCRRYVKHRIKLGRAESTARKELGTLKTALRYCHTEGYLTQVPGVWMPEKPDPKDRWLTREEAASLLRSAKDEQKARLHLPLFILISLYTAARKEAVLSLQWQPSTTGGWVDLENELIYWWPQQRRKTKSKKRRPRAVPIPRRLLTFLWYARRRTRQYVVEVERKRPDGNTEKARAHNIKRSFATAAKKAGFVDERTKGLEKKDQKAEFSPHVLDHTAITWLVQSGTPLWEVAGFAGRSLEIIESTYGHHAPDYMEKARTALD